MIAVNDFHSKSPAAPGPCLVVMEEGHSLIGKQLQGVFTGLGFSLLQAAGAEEALRSCWRNAPAVILVPQRMKLDDAAMLLRRIRKMPRARRAVVLVYGERLDAGAVGRLVWEGASDGIAQPFNRAIVLSKLRQAGLEGLAQARLS